MNTKHTLWWGIGLTLLVIVLFGVGRFSSHSSQSTLSTRDTALACTSDMATQFHIHPHLQIVVNGEEHVIPGDIGITAACMHPLHTHDASGIIHVESPQKRDFTLGDFFAVWGQPFSKDQVLDSKVDATHSIRVTVNGQEVSTYENTIFRDGDQIVVSYASKP
ncbi:hypothetical protein HY090_02020 [Candidatus Kaiserbacteria bacterium]|nr:hypothetical protein [Candidatus Kaiserbacteria bacterium]